ncbi:MAG TPA: sulfite exporter TauE/SafE family protein [Acidobacteriaceae bacterium]|nr:sulfite exporter TauE/SafE family protein [Acidobacteriaceae bacterium]
MPIAVWIVPIVFIASLIRSTFGFGEALVAVPLLALVIPIDVAAPLAVLLSIVIAAIIVAQDWRHIHLRSSLWLLLPTFAGIPLGVLLLGSAHPFAVKGVLAVIILLFSAYSLFGTALPELKSDSHAALLLCGFLAGIMGGAYGMNGPPLVIYGAMRRWSPQRFRATLQGYFLPASIAAAVGFHFAGLWTTTITHLFLISLPAAVVATFLGRFINLKLRGELFLKTVHICLLIVGVVLLAQAIHRT